MDRLDESPSGWLAQMLWLAGILVVSLAIVGFFWVKWNVTNSLHRADGFELSETCKRWVEAGQPHGQKLADFMQGRRADLVVSNRTFAIDGVTYSTEFAVTRPKSGRHGIMFVTTNGVLVWMQADGSTKTFSLNGSSGSARR